jgi:Icc-related predicted phosphoesterase
MRLAYTADLHGDIESYRALLAFAAASGAGAAIVGGDLLPHTAHRQDAIRRQRAFVEQSLRPLLERFSTQHPAVHVFLLPGNDDWAAAVAALDQLVADGLAHTLHEQIYPLDDQTWLAGYACVPLTPFSIKDYERRDDGPLPPLSFAIAFASSSGVVEPVTAAEIERLPSIAEALDALAQQSDPRRTVYVCHTPPAETPLDLMPRGRHVGSRALRAFIERRQPPLTLHGHIHEAPALSGRFACQIGQTWCVNPGHDQRRFHAVTLDTDDIAGTIEHTIFGKL